MKTRCPYCKRSYTVEDEFEGQMIPCPGCNELFRIRQDGQRVFKVAEHKPEPEPSFWEKNRRWIIIGGAVAGAVLLAVILACVLM